MHAQKPQYISASRRNDLPRFHYREFFSAWQAGEITYDGGYGRSYTVSLRREDVLGYVFWSKDFSHFIEQPQFEKLTAANNTVFHYTINNCPALEPHLPPLENRFPALRDLCTLVGAERVFWRFDPICRYEKPGGGVASTEQAFFDILPLVASTGLKRCYFSFMTMYNKTEKRAVRFLPFQEPEQKDIASAMLAAAADAGMILYNCCNDAIPRLVPGIRAARCIDDEILRETDRFGVHRPLKPAPTRKGCGCCESRDIGSYSPACAHGCLYCYANPKLDRTGD